MIGQILGGRYQILEQLGKGGFGITFTAIDTGRPGNPPCVVKLFKPMSTDPYNLEVGKRLFVREAEKLEKLGKHDQIPRLLAYFEENQEFYLVQEYIEGHDLSRELVSGVQLSEAYVIKLLQDILEVLDFVHQQNLIHRDLKTSNIRRRQSDDKIVLIDFGAVKEVSTQVVNPQGQVSFPTCIGSPGYMPSEQKKGDPKLSSDIYAVGIVAIQALTGINPDPRLGAGLPTNPQTGEIVWRDAYGGKVRTQVSDKLANIIDKMVRYDYRQRYQSANEVLQALKTLSPKVRSGKLWLGIGLAAVITPLIFWILSKIIHPQPTLETYNEPKFGITIKYPSNDWEFIEPPSGNFDNEVVQFKRKNKNQVDSCPLVITIDVNPKLLSLEESKKEAVQNIKNINLNSEVKDDYPSTTLSKLNAYKLTYTRQEGQCKLKAMEIGTVRDGKIYFITYTAEEKEYNKYLELAEKMINSFEIKVEEN
ncbi:MAG: protein kinase [Nostoc sp. DedSLP03]|uniref:protein kinase domain-containing protein n=1 Tax=Nostoc sp. DedSLP03 TaxID=3075400 RepID=UPI002AD34F88|nr:protein kinase [Nostoc sp. DedSLP03]MDZ7965269.1 protein kinase [Nostoc sp. DedSLP03]